MRPFTTRLSSIQTTRMPETAIVSRASETPVDTGGTTQVFATVLSTVPARIGPVGRDPQEREIAGRIATGSAYVVTVPAGTDVREGDRITIDGRVFNVIAPIRRSYETARRCVCSEAR